jgi:hypothetical protein
MRLSLVVFGVAVAATTAFGTNARAQNYPWCAQLGDGEGGATNCGFSTLQQCQADVSGLGGFCEPNNSYVPPQSATPAPRRPRKTS